MDDGRGVRTAALRSCGSCGTQLSANAKFCSECGTQVTRVGPAAQYKQVTVLFADVVRSMDIAAALDMERLREVMTELLVRSAAVARRYGGGTVEYTGDGLMVIFGAPVALEDHAFRGCLAALAIQKEVDRLAAGVAQRDGVALRLRVGMNSGRVIVGEMGASTYAATGETVGFAHRIQSAAPPGGVMLSEATARLVERTVQLAEPEWVQIKGVDDPVRAQRLLAIDPRDGLVGRVETSLVGRRWEVAALDAMLERTIGRRGGVINVVGPPGIGKSRLAREAAALAAARGVEVSWGFCESHARDIPFHALTRLLRARTGVATLDDRAGRALLRRQLSDADRQDVLLLDDLLGIADPDVPLPQMDPDARRRRLTALVKAYALSQTRPALLIVEDVHWIDAVSESMLADFLAVTPHTASMVLITSRPEYAGALLGAPGAQTIPVARLSDSQTTVLLQELLGSDPSVAQLTAVIAERAAGNPFFVEEMVRELVQRRVLAGDSGDYTCAAAVGEVSVPATVAATIEARIDGLSQAARRTLHAASVIGARFGAELLSTLGVEAEYDELLRAELIDQMRFGQRPEYAFRHPLIRSVAYESQLKSDRAEWHRRLATAIETGAPGSADEHAALIAEHLDAAGELHGAYAWHMRAGAWSTNRDLVAARLSWERASRIADALPADDRDRLVMRIAPRTMLCATDWQAREAQESQERFAVLGELCEAAGDKVSLAIGMTGPATEHCYAGRTHAAAAVSSRQMELLESTGDTTPAMGLVGIAFVNWIGVGAFDKIIRWSQIVIDLAGGDPGRGAGFGVASPLAIASAWRGTARWWLGRTGWREDLNDAMTIAQRSNAETFSGASAWAYGFALQYGVLRAEDSVVRLSEDALRTARAASSDRAMGLAAYTLAVGLLNRDAAAERQRGLELMMQTRDIWLRKRALFLIPVTDMWAARETSLRGDLAASIPVMRQAVGELRRARHLFYGVWAAGVLVQTLLQRGAEDDLVEAREAIDWLASLAAEVDSAILEVMLLRLRALLCRAVGDQGVYRDVAERYRARATDLGFEGHMDWANEMLQVGPAGG